MTLKKIGQIAGIPSSSVQYKIKNAGYTLSELTDKNTGDLNDLGWQIVLSKNKRGRKKKDREYLTCSYCGKKYLPNYMNAYNKQKYCSRECAADALRSHKDEKLCVVCGKPFAFSDNNKQCCSIECVYVKRHRDAQLYAQQRKHKKQEKKKQYKRRKALQKKKQEALQWLNANVISSQQIGMNICECPVCGLFFFSTKRKYCSDRCQKKAANSTKDVKRRQKIKKALVDSDITVEGLYKRDAGICYICGKSCSYDDYTTVDGAFIAGDWYPSIDHVVPLAKGGMHSWDNVKLAHRRCNYLKSDNVNAPII